VTDEPRFKLVLHKGVDTLHIEHPHEECNVDDATDVRMVDAMTAEAMLAGKQAVACQHCQPSV
jgi:hypothetical protein